MIAHEVAARVLTRFPRETVSAGRASDPTPLEEVLNGVAKWLNRVDLRLGPADLTPERWIQQFGDEPEPAQWRMLELVKRVPELFTTVSVLTWLGDQIRRPPPVEEQRDTEDGWSNKTDLARKGTTGSRGYELLGWLGRVLESLQPSTAREPLLRVISGSLSDPDGKIVARAAAAASLLAPVDEARFALEPGLIALANSAAHDRRQSSLAAEAAARLGSIHPIALDWLHAQGQRPCGTPSRQASSAPEVETQYGATPREVGAVARQRSALEARLLERLNATQPARDIIATLRGFRPTSPVVPSSADRQIERLIRDPRPDVRSAAATALVALTLRAIERQGTTNNQRAARNARRRIIRLLSSRSVLVRLAVLRAMRSDSYTDPPLARGSLARLIGDPSREVRRVAVKIARSRCRWLPEQDFLDALRVGLSEGGPGAWEATVALWRQVDGTDREVGSDADERLAGILAAHDPVAWRHALMDVLRLPNTAGDEALWRELTTRLQMDRPIPGGAVSWRAVRSAAPEWVQREIGRSLLRFCDARERAHSAVQALAPREPLHGVWDTLLDALGRPDVGVVDSLEYLRRYVSVPNHIAAHIVNMLPPEGDDQRLWGKATRALATIRPRDVPAECLRGLIDLLAWRGGTFSMRDGVRTLLSCLSDVNVGTAADHIIRAVETAGGGNRIYLARFGLVPLARRGEPRSLEYLLRLCRDGEFAREIIGDVTDLLPVFSLNDLRRILEEGLSEERGLPGDLRGRVAAELARREGPQDLELWHRLAVDGDERPEVRGAALALLANTAGRWPLGEDEVCKLISGGHDFLRETVVASLPSAYPFGIPLCVVDSLVRHGHVERLIPIAGRLQPTARTLLVALLVNLTRTSTPRHSLAILGVLQDELFRAMPGTSQIGIWECLHHPERSIRRSASRLVIRIGRGWLLCGGPHLGGSRTRNDLLATVGEFPEWLLSQVRKALAPESSTQAFRTAIRVIRDLGDVADQPEVVELLANTTTTLNRRRAATKRLSALGYVLDGNDHERRTIRVTAFARSQGV